MRSSNIPNEISVSEHPGNPLQDLKSVGFLTKLLGRSRQSDAKADVTPLGQRLADVGAWSNLEALRLGPSGRSGEFRTGNPSTLMANLLATSRFCLDTKAGKVLHPGALAFREVSNRESLHVALSGTRVSAHLDRVSPLVGRKADKGHCRYSVSRVAAHVTGRVGARLVRKLKGGWIRLDVSCSRLRSHQRVLEPGAGSLGNMPDIGVERS
jgi:hypothetical protein